MVHVRKLEDRTLTFIVSGKLWRNSLIMQDKESETLWSHITGEALNGELKGKKLTIIPSVQTTWSRWAQQHPDTKVLRKETEVKSSHYERYFSNPDRTGIFRTRWLKQRMPGKSKVLGITRGLHALAIADDKLGDGAVLNVSVGEDSLVVVRAGDGGVQAYLARAEGKDLQFESAEDQSMAKDRETGSTWDMDKGVCIEGKFKGAALEKVVVRRAFWFAWSSFYPHTNVID